MVAQAWRESQVLKRPFARWKAYATLGQELARACPVRPLRLPDKAAGESLR